MNTIEQKVMASVGLIYIARTFVSATALRIYTLLLSVVGIGLFVSLPHVMQNFETALHGGLSSIAWFVFSAIVGTTLLVQISLLLGSAAVVSLFARVARTFATGRTHFA